MGKAVSRGQALEVSARVCTQVNWDALDGDDLQKGVIQLSPEEFGRRFTDFIKNGAKAVVIFFSTTLSLAGIILDPKEFIGKGWSVWRNPAVGDGLDNEEEQDARALAMTELDAAKLRFETCLVDGEKGIKGEEKLKRLLVFGQPLAGGKQFLALWQDYQANKERSVLEWLRREKEVTYLDFFGTILRSPNGNRCFLCLCWNGSEWLWVYDWLADVLDAGRPSAVLA
jgi:hypothetical protein